MKNCQGKVTSIALYKDLRVMVRERKSTFQNLYPKGWNFKAPACNFA